VRLLLHDGYYEWPWQTNRVEALKKRVCATVIQRQEAPLSQRDRALFRVIEYLAKSLKVTQGHLK